MKNICLVNLDLGIGGAQRYISNLANFLSEKGYTIHILLLNDKPVLQNKGKVSHTQMEQTVGAIFETFSARRKTEEAQLADKDDKDELKEIENKIKKTKK